MGTPLQMFVSVALPTMATLVITIGLSSWSQNRRFDEINGHLDDLQTDMAACFAEVNRRIDQIVIRLVRIEIKLYRRQRRPSPLS